MPSNTTRDTLLQAMKSKDYKKFHVTLLNEGWPNDSPWSDYELLVEALKANHRMIARIILNKGARVWNSTVVDETPLHIAVSKKTLAPTKLVVKLLAAGARVDAKNSAGDSALHLAFNNKVSFEIIDAMLRSHAATGPAGQLDVANEEGLRFLHIACTRPHFNIVKMIANTFGLNAQVSLDSGKGYAGYTALHFAVDNGRHEIAKFLIEQGANINTQDANETTSLHLALRLRDVQMIDLLLALDKEKRNIINKFGLSHFMVACAGSKPSIVKAHLEKSLAFIPLQDLISARANKVENCKDYTPLHFAVDLNQIDNVDFLLEVGADCCSVAVNGLTPHMLAEKRGHENVGKILREHCKIVSACRAMRRQEADSGKWGRDYERSLLVDAVRNIKQLRKTWIDFKIMSDTFQPPT